MECPLYQTYEGPPLNFKDRLQTVKRMGLCKCCFLCLVFPFLLQRPFSTWCILFFFKVSFFACLYGNEVSPFFMFFIYFILFLALSCAGFLVAASGGYSLLRCAGFSLRWLLLLWSMGSRRAGFSSCSTRAQQLWLAGSRAQAQQLWRTGLVAPQHVGSSRTRARTHVPSIGRRILNHRTTKEALNLVHYLQVSAHIPSHL